MSWDSRVFENALRDAHTDEFMLNKSYLLELLQMTDEQALLEEQIVDVAKLFEIEPPTRSGGGGVARDSSMSLEMFVAFSLFGTEKDPSIWSEFQEWICKKAISLLKKYFLAKFEKLQGGPTEGNYSTPSTSGRMITGFRSAGRPRGSGRGPGRPRGSRGRARGSRGGASWYGGSAAKYSIRDQPGDSYGDFDDDISYGGTPAKHRGTFKLGKEFLGDRDMPATMYQCTDCPYVTARPSIGIRHYLLVHGQFYPYLCTKCDMNFKSKDSIYQHFRLQKYHANSSDEINYQYVDEKMLDEARTVAKKNVVRFRGGPIATLEELEKAADNTAFIDQSFSMQIPRKRVRHDYPKPMYNAPNYRYRCSVCDFSTSAVGQMQRHVTSEHVTLRPYSCRLCEQSFASDSAANSHVRLQHPECPESTDGYKADAESVLGLKALVEQLYYDAGGGPDETGALENIMGDSVLGEAVADILVSEGEGTTLEATAMEQDEKYSGMSFRCSICDYSEVKYSQISKHIHISHCSDIKPFICSLCSFRSAAHHDVASHFASCHPNDAVAIITDSNLKKEIEVKVDSIAIKEPMGGVGDTATTATDVDEQEEQFVVVQEPVPAAPSSSRDKSGLAVAAAPEEVEVVAAASPPLKRSRRQAAAAAAAAGTT